MLDSPFDRSNPNLDAVISDTVDGVSRWYLNMHIFLVQQKTRHPCKTFWQFSAEDVTRVVVGCYNQEVIPDQDESCQYQLFCISGRDASYLFVALYCLREYTALPFFIGPKHNKILLYECSYFALSGTNLPTEKA